MAKNFFTISTILLAVVCLICISICISRKKRIQDLLPMELGHIFKFKGDDYIVVPFDALLQPTDSNNTVILFNVINDFWEDPAKELNSFYKEGNSFGISVRIKYVEIFKASNYLFVIVDNYGREYFLKTQFLPSHYRVKMHSFVENNAQQGNR